MTKLNLFDICTVHKENVTSNALEYLLEQYPQYRKPFLSLIQSLPPAAQLDKCEVAREEKIGEDSRIDLVLSGNDWLVYIENKPWQQSNFGTTGEQLKRYAQHLAPRTPNNRILCLLTREDCKNKLCTQPLA